MPALSFSAERFGLSFLFRPMIEIRFEIRHLEFLWGGVSASRMLQYWAKTSHRQAMTFDSSSSASFN